MPFIENIVPGSPEADFIRQNVRLFTSAQVNNVIDNETGNTVLHYAVISGFMNAVSKLMKVKDINLNIKNNQGLCPLFYALLINSSTIVDILIDSSRENRIDINKKINDDPGITYLHLVAINGIELFGIKRDEATSDQIEDAKSKLNEFINLAVAKGADVHKKDNNGLTPLFNAHVNLKPEMVDILINIPGVGIDEPINESGISSMHIIAKAGLEAALDLMALKGGNVNFQDQNGETPAFYAALTGQISIFDKLVILGADPNQKNKNGLTPLFYALNNNQTDMIEHLKNKYNITVDDVINSDKEDPGHAGFTYLHIGAINGSEALVALVISRGANPNAKDKNGDTALCWAVSKAHSSVVTFLLGLENIDVFNKNDQGKTAMFYALEQKNPDMVNLLLPYHGIDTPVDNDGNTCLQMALSLELFELAAKLIKDGADLNVKGESPFTPAELISFLAPATKKTYFPDFLTEEERAELENPADYISDDLAAVSLGEVPLAGDGGHPPVDNETTGG